MRVVAVASLLPTALTTIELEPVTEPPSSAFTPPATVESVTRTVMPMALSETLVALVVATFFLPSATLASTFTWPVE